MYNIIFCTNPSQRWIDLRQTKTKILFPI